jgi:sec-independent protein translocase protein TatA
VVFEGALQPVHWLVVLLIFVVLFGGKKLPELGKGLGEAIRGFKSAMRDGGSEPQSPAADKTLPPPQA